MARVTQLYIVGRGRYGIPFGIRKPYEGILAGPSLPGAAGTKMMLEKLELLFDHYEVDHGDWRMLAQHLAADHVPHFLPPEESGQRFDFKASAELLVAFAGAKSKRKRARDLVRKDPRYEGQSAEYLRQRESSLRTLMATDTYRGNRLRKFYRLAGGK